MVYMIASDSSDLKPEQKKPFKVSDFQELNTFINEKFSPEERSKLKNPKYFYQVTFDKPGELVMPILVELTFDDGTKENYTFPAQIWRMNDKEAIRTFATDKEIVKIMIDPNEETADIDTKNNSWPKEEVKSKFD
jgi:hypothetical protein